MVLRGNFSAIVILIGFCVAQFIDTCEAVDLEFKTYHFRKKSREVNNRPIFIAYISRAFQLRSLALQE